MSSPFAPTMVIATFQPFFTASASPAATIFFAASSVMNLLVPNMPSSSKIQILRNSRSVFSKRVRKQFYPTFRFGQIVVVEIDIQQVDIPGKLDAVHHVGFDNLSRNRQRGVLRRIVNVAVAGLPEFVVFLGKQSLA